MSVVIPKETIDLLVLNNCFNFKELKDKHINISKNQPMDIKFSIFSINLNNLIFRKTEYSG